MNLFITLIEILMMVIVISAFYKLLIPVIITLSIISFVGIYNQDVNKKLNESANKVKKYIITSESNFRTSLSQKLSSFLKK
jgi:hypothetical protein